MSAVAKRLAAAALALAGLGAAGFSAAVWLGERKMNRHVDVRVVPVAFTHGADALRRGKALYETHGCAECHGADGRGRALIDEPRGLQVHAPNITSAADSAVAGYTEADWVRAVRHGVDPHRRALLLMPSEYYKDWSDAELAALVAYVRSLPPAPGTAARIRLPAHVMALYGAGALRDAAEQIDHRRPPPPDEGAEERPYLANVEHVKRLNRLDWHAIASSAAQGEEPKR